MKISNFKKYILFIIISFVAAIGVVSADSRSSSIKPEFNGSPVVIPKDDYLGLTCSADGTLNALSLYEDSEKISIKYDKKPLTSGTDKIKCTWTGRGRAGYENDGGQKTYIFNYNVIKDSVINVVINGTVKDKNGLNLKADVYNKINNVYAKNVNITSITNKQNAQYLDWSNCTGGNTCIVFPTDAALNKHNTVTSSAVFHYTGDGLTGDQTVKVNFKISYTGGIRLYPGGYGTCNINTSQFKHVGFSNYSYWESIVSGNVTLPTCTPTNISRSQGSPDKTSGILEFKGWVSVPDEEYENPDYQKIGQCEGAINGTVSVDTGENYVACYNYKNGVQLVIDATSSELASSSQCRSTSYGIYFCESTADFPLPSVTQKDNRYGQNKTFKGWVKDNKGSTITPGTPVKTNESATYYAQYESTVVETDRHKSVYVGQSSFLVVPDMVSCSVASNSKLSAKMQNNECAVAGLAPTDDNEFIDVSVGVKNADGSTKNLTYKFSVLTNNKTEGANGTFVIDVDSRIISGETNSSALNDFDHKMCNFARISYRDLEYSDINDQLNSNNYKAVCDDSSNPELNGKEYFALCMDPGRAGPSNELYNISEHVYQGSELGKMIGVIIQYINKNTSAGAFDDKNNPVRIAAHVAIRTVVLISGYSGVTEYSDSAYYSHYQAYLKLAEDLRAIYDKYKVNDEGKVPTEGDARYSEFESEVSSAVESFGVDNGTAKRYLKEMFMKYKNYEYDEGSGFQRTIDSKETVVNGANSYTVTYKGKFTLPVDAQLSRSYNNYQYLNKTGVTGTATLTLNTAESSSSPRQDVYDYTVVIKVTDAKNVQLPKNPKEELEYSLKLTYSGGIDYSSVRIGNPSAGAASKQRMIVFDLTSNDTNIYFNINGNADKVCTGIDSLDYTKCPSADSCDSSFNESLFKASGCCREILDEDTYSYLIQNVCNGKCSVSTMSNVCSYDPTDDSKAADLYEIKEGAQYTSSEGKYKNAIGTCIVNVKGNYALDYEAGEAGSYSTHSNLETPAGSDHESEYFKYDDRGNSINVASYQTNMYCQVTCREDWKITMGAFGNFVGRNAVMAGTFFQNHDNDIFIEGGRTCYTTYLDYDKFMKDVVAQSRILADAYNKYSNSSHSYSDVKAQTDESEQLVFNYDSDACVKYTYHINQGKNPETGVTDPVSTGWHCSTTNGSLDKPYGYFSLDLDHKFLGDGDNSEGTYHNYTPAAGTTSDPIGSDATPQYSQDTHKGSCTWPAAPSGSAAEGATYDRKPTTGGTDGCYEGEEGNRASAFEKLQKEMMDDAESDLNGYFATMNSAYNKIVSYYEQFWNCQHFELNNATDATGDKANNDMNYDLFMGKKKAFNQILTMFEPFVSYTYDESAYMTILQDDNILVEHDTLNDQFFEKDHQPKSYKESTNVSVPAQVGFADKCKWDSTANKETCEKIEPIDVELSRNKLNFAYYKPTGVWTADDLVRTYGKNIVGDKEVTTGYNACGTSDGECNKPITINGFKTDSSKVTTKTITMCSIGSVPSGGSGSTSFDPKTGSTSLTFGSSRVPDWVGGKCYDYSVYYLNSHYIEASITNSSFYRNKGIWYTGPNDTREHGDDLDQAWDNAAKRPNGPSYTDRSEEERSRWSVLVGTKKTNNVINGNLNIFPISMTTARNLYQYTYEFTQIGSYTDGRLGRVMGDAASLIPHNLRTCFYEVVENICLCCGDPIVTYTNTDVPSAEDFVQSSGYHYDFNQDTGYDSAKGTLGFNTSTVALSDLNGATDRDLGNNWTGAGSFFYGGNKLSTNKGQVALEEIQERGEKVYLNTGSGGETPEYSFELKPGTLAAIRDYNDIYGYEVNYGNLTLYGRSSIQPLGECSDPNSCNWFANPGDDTKEMDNYIANFGHYGSNFLENFDSITGTDGAASADNLSNKSRSLDVCAIVRNDDATAAKNELKNKINSGKCRWIDYIEQAEVESVWDSGGPTTQYYRLAFK